MYVYINNGNNTHTQTNYKANVINTCPPYAPSKALTYRHMCSHGMLEL